jgi:hypothetical protein
MVVLPLAGYYKKVVLDFAAERKGRQTIALADILEDRFVHWSGSKASRGKFQHGGPVIEFGFDEWSDAFLRPPLFEFAPQDGFTGWCQDRKL